MVSPSTHDLFHLALGKTHQIHCTGLFHLAFDKTHQLEDVEVHHEAHVVTGKL